MKVQSQIVKWMFGTAVAVCLMVLPALVFGQNPGDQPDSRPPEVPLDPGMTVILIGMGIMLALKVIRKRAAMLRPQAVKA